jgi:hypothetical protein
MRLHGGDRLRSLLSDAFRVNGFHPAEHETSITWPDNSAARFHRESYFGGRAVSESVPLRKIFDMDLCFMFAGHESVTSTTGSHGERKNEKGKKGQGKAMIEFQTPEQCYSSSEPDLQFPMSIKLGKRIVR